MAMLAPSPISSHAETLYMPIPTRPQSSFARLSNQFALAPHSPNRSSTASPSSYAVAAASNIIRPQSCILEGPKPILLNAANHRMPHPMGAAHSVRSLKAPFTSTAATTSSNLSVPSFLGPRQFKRNQPTTSRGVSSDNEAVSELLSIITGLKSDQYSSYDDDEEEDEAEEERNDYEGEPEDNQGKFDIISPVDELSFWKYQTGQGYQARISSPLASSAVSSTSAMQAAPKRKMKAVPKIITHHQDAKDESRNFSENQICAIHYPIARSLNPLHALKTPVTPSFTGLDSFSSDPSAAVASGHQQPSSSNPPPQYPPVQSAPSKKHTRPRSLSVSAGEILTKLRLPVELDIEAPRKLL